MKRILINILVCIPPTIALAALILGIIFSGRQRRELRCRGIAVEVLDSASNKFLDGREVVKIVDRDFGGYVNRYVDSVNLQKVEDVLCGIDFIKSCQAFMDKTGMMHVRISQHSPVLKFRRSDGRILYLDECGGSYPVECDWAQGLKIADGHLKTGDRIWMASLSDLAVRISRDKRLSSLVCGIHCRPNSEILLEMEGMREIFDIGVPTDLDAKLFRIGKYLDDIAPEGKQYSMVTVKYSKQIICKIWKENTSLQ